MKLGWRQGILYVTVLGMEGCWLYALMVLLNKQVADGCLVIFGLLLLYPLAFGFNKLLQNLRWPKFCLGTVSWLVWVVGMLLMVKIQLFGDLRFSDPAWLLALPQAIAQLIYTFKPELLILVSSAVLWWLGRRLAYLKIDFATSVGEFQFGLVILLITFFVASQLRVDLADSVFIALTFFLFALLGMSVAHAQGGTSWLSGLYQGHWSGLLLVSISLILILGLLIASVVTPDLLQLVWAALKWVWGLILKVIAFIVSLLPEPEPAEPPPPIPMPMPEVEPSEGFKWWTMPEAVRSGFRIGWGVMVFGLLLVVLWRISSQIFVWFRHRLTSMAGAELEPLPGAFTADLLSWLRHILLKVLGFRLLFRLRGKSKFIPPEVASIRQIYRQLLRWAAAGGYPRQMSQTPHEYLYTLEGLLPEARGDLDFVTEQYVSTRYGSSLPTEGELYQLRQSWHKIRQNRLKRPGSKHTHE